MGRRLQPAQTPRGRLGRTADGRPVRLAGLLLLLSRRSVGEARPSAAEDVGRVSLLSQVACQDLPSSFGKSAEQKELPSPFGRGAEQKELPSPSGRGAGGEGLVRHDRATRSRLGGRCSPRPRRRLCQTPRQFFDAVRHRDDGAAGVRSTVCAGIGRTCRRRQARPGRPPALRSGLRSRRLLGRPLRHGPCLAHRGSRGERGERREERGERRATQRPVGSGQWAVGSGQSAVGSRQSAVGSRQWAVGSGQSAVGSGQWAVGSGQWAVGSRQWAVGSRQSAVGSRQSAVESGEWGVERRHLFRLPPSAFRPLQINNQQPRINNQQSPLPFPSPLSPLPSPRRLRRTPRLGPRVQPQQPPLGTAGRQREHSRPIAGDLRPVGRGRRQVASASTRRSSCCFGSPAAT